MQQVETTKCARPRELGVSACDQLYQRLSAPEDSGDWSALGQRFCPVFATFCPTDQEGRQR